MHSRKHLYESQEGDNHEENSTQRRKKVARDLGLHLGCGGAAGVERGSRQPRRRRLRAKSPPEAEARAVGRRVRGRSHSSTTRRRSGGIFRRVRRRRRRRSVGSRWGSLVDSVHRPVPVAQTALVDSRWVHCVRCVPFFPQLKYFGYLLQLKRIR